MNVRFKSQKCVEHSAPEWISEVPQVANHKHPAPPERVSENEITAAHRGAAWPYVVLGFSGVMTVLWIALLGWGAFKLVEMLLA